MVDVRRNLLILVLMLAMIVTLSYALMGERRNDAVSASLRLSGQDVEELAQTIDRSPFHRKRAEEIFDLLTRDGDQAYAAENWEEAGEAYRKALRLSPRDPGLLRQYSKVMYLQKRLDEAISALARRRQVLPMRVETHTDLALALYRADRLDEAKMVLGEGLDLLGDGDAGPLYFLAGCIHRESGEHEVADQLMAAAEQRLSPNEARYARRLWDAQSKQETAAVADDRQRELREQPTIEDRTENR